MLHNVKLCSEMIGRNGLTSQFIEAHPHRFANISVLIVGIFVQIAFSAVIVRYPITDMNLKAIETEPQIFGKHSHQRTFSGTNIAVEPQSSVEIVPPFDTVEVIEKIGNQLPVRLINRKFGNNRQCRFEKRSFTIFDLIIREITCRWCNLIALDNRS